MKSINHYLTILSVILLGMNWSAKAQCTVTFTYTGGFQLWTVPVGISQIQVDAQGAVGGSSINNSGGCGGRVYCNMAVTAGQVLLVYVGGAGGNGTIGTGGAGGFNGGAAGGTVGGGGGGGESDVRNGGGGLANRIVVAGGGGGGGTVCGGSEPGGPGGNFTGGSTPPCSTDFCGGGGTQSLGGAGGAYSGFSSGAGTPGIGGAGATGITATGGGGGGGYFGGGGGSGGAGGGGSSFAYAGLTNNVTDSQGYNCSVIGNGLVVIHTFPVAGPIVGRDTMCIGGTTTLTDPASTGAGVWSSSNTAIGTIGAATGLAGGRSAGTFIITYTVTSVCGTGISTETAYVAPGPITRPTPGICKGQTTDTLSDFLSGGIWTSANTAVAQVGSHNGVVSSGTTTGTATISYEVDGCYATVQVTVNPLPGPIVGDSNICQKLSETLTEVTGGGIWTSADMALITIGSTSGYATADSVGASGRALIYYTLPLTGCQTSYYLTVQSPPQPMTLWNALIGNTITIPGEDTVICQGSTDTLSITFPSGGVWSSSAPGVAAITPLFGGGITFVYGVGYDAALAGITGGTAIISYTIPGCPPSTVNILVNPLPAPIDGIPSICTGLPVSLSDSLAGGTWSSTDTSVATIDSITGVVTTNIADTVGEATVIVYTLPTGCLITQVVTVANAPHPITGTDSVCQGASVTYFEDTTGGTWSSSVLAIAQVIDSSGVVNGITAGTATISYTLPSGCYAARPILVKPPIPAFVTAFWHPEDTICAGTPVVFWATDSNAGVPTFQWQRFDTGLLGQVTDTLRYTPNHGDVIIIRMITHGICSVKDTVYDTAAINVWPIVIPSVVISVADTVDRMLGADSLYMLDYPGQIFTFFSDVTYGSRPTYQWFVNDSAIAGATSSSFAFAAYGNDTVYCRITGYPPCDTTLHFDTSNRKIIYGAYLGVNPVTSANSGLTLFPNPNNGGFTLSGMLSNRAANTLDIEITNVLGQIVYSGKGTTLNGVVSRQITLDHNIPAGSYALRIMSGTENEIFHFEITK